MDFIELSQSRRSVREYLRKDVSKEDVTKLLKAAQSAPSAGNCQPWHFFVIRDKAIQTEIASKATRQPFIAAAPVVIVVCADVMANKEYYGARGKTLYCIQDTAAAVQNILLCATSLGLGACWCGAFDEKIVSEILALPKERRPVAIVPVGHISDEPLKPVSRMPIDEVVTFVGE